MNPAAEPVSQARPDRAVNSFDVFDTLIARRCITPDGVFARVEREQAMPGFAALRRQAELALAGTPYGIADIYARLALLAGLSPSRADALRRAEIAAEHEELIPIAENLQRVRDGDLLLSDMYLDVGTIRGLLDQAGLQRQVGLVVTAQGKSSGEVWPTLLKQVAIGLHLGDNAHADGAMPSRFGIAVEHSALSRPTGIEGWLIGVGLGDMACVLREARLRSFTADPVSRRLQIIQTQLNAPILLLASIALHRLAARLGAARLLFASRDCNLWLLIYRALSATFGESAPAEYFFTSRKARISPSPAYCAYAADRLADDALIVDLCGSGWSLALLLQTLGLRDRQCFLIHQLAHVPLYQSKAATPDTCITHALVPPAQRGVDHIMLEMANYADYGSVIDIRRIGDAILPVLDAEGRSATELKLVASQREALALVAGILREQPLKAVMALDDSTIAAVVTEFCKLLSRETILSEIFGWSHYGEDVRTLHALDLVG